ncbi:MAG TPA: S46 family peptidase [Chitinophagaceae bacterium]|nr:S46 family peptidase [Chitinophagaceae bacterium]
MRKLFITIIFVFVLFFKSFADEGMWLPLLLGQQVYNDMVKRGLKLTKEQLYSINKPSLKDAIVIFGGGCTGEIVSPEGLVFTNHHCGYEVIASASTVDHNYLRDGFYSKSRGEEIPADGLTVQFLLRIDDVTKEVMDSLQGLSGMERVQRQQKVIMSINSRLSDTAQSIEARISPLFKGNQFLVFIYQRYKDVRLVVAPPENLGKFGGDTDNWEWPRHTIDFAVFRVYSDKNGKPAKYAEGNIPLKPKWFLPISIKGVKEGDYAMIYGYPGSTNRYETSYGVKQKIEIDNPTLVKLRDMRLKYMFAEMKKDPAIKLQLASSYASIANYWKFFDGETKQLLKYDVYGQKKKAEEQFAGWAKGKQEYENIFTDWSKAYDDWRPYSKNRMYMNEGIYGSPLIMFAGSLLQVEKALVGTGSSAGDVKKALDMANSYRKEFLTEENKTSDQNILATVTKMYYEDVPQDQHPTGFYNELRNQYGDLKDEATYKKFAADVFSKTMIFDDTRWNDFTAHPDANKLQQDPAFNFASTFTKNYNNKYSPYFQQFNAKNNELGRLYLKGIMQKDTVKAKKMYPDATFTMRVSYGTVKGYNPRDAVHYDCVTTSKGFLEKYIPEDYEFDIYPKVLEMMKKKDFGQYIDKGKNDLVVAFITNNDITGGNSGSPVVNSKGELLGLAFDGNYEALSHKIAYDKDLNRTICVDIRAVLWTIDKVGGDQTVIKELKIVK